MSRPVWNGGSRSDGIFMSKIQPMSKYLKNHVKGKVEWRKIPRKSIKIQRENHLKLPKLLHSNEIII